MGSVDEIIERAHGVTVAAPSGADGTAGEPQPAPPSTSDIRRHLPPYNDLYNGLAGRIENVDYDGLGFVMSVFGLIIRILGVI